ncbi:hypothetical protein SASPL_123896 [Salvia splendens]|uniref:Uncharacterized protein n=1 Tax=Salvia splendens TaxID=180675 RepID=A0A8X8XLW1_SALSN|nr:uncharacterized protein LOC121743723 [Salvia splendens]KAG6416466.1 hypothetical protein SASPL_123896 [Salvia splendens]
MKKLYKKSTVHPTPSVVSEHLLSFLPAAILALTATLSPAEREVLAYLISCSSVNFSTAQRKSTPQKTPAPGDDHAACFNCNCFRCYMSYWAKWDSSPNRQLIHEAIDAFEEKESRKDKNKKERRKGKSVKLPILSEPKHSEPILTDADFCFVDSITAAESGGGGGGEQEEEEEIVITEEEFDKGSVRRFVGFLGDRIWRIWG